MSREPATTESDEDDIHNSTTVEVAARVGLVIYGLVHLIFAYVAIQLVFTDASGSSTGTGALRQLAQDDVGRLTLGAVALGLAPLVPWQLIVAAVGYPDDDGWKRHVMRFGALARAAVFGYLTVASARLALQGSSGSGGGPDSMSARVMAAPAGAALLTLVGLVVIGVGIGQIVFGLTKKFLEQLDEDARRQDRRIPIVLVGQIGYVAKGLAMVLVGGLVAWAALTNDPKKSGGLDTALLKLLGGTYGKPTIVVIAVGIGWFGVYVLIRSRHMASDSVTA